MTRFVRVRRHTRRRGAIQVKEYARSLKRRVRGRIVEVESRYRSLPERERKLLKTTTFPIGVMSGLTLLRAGERVVERPTTKVETVLGERVSRMNVGPTARDIRKFQKYIYKKKYFVFPPKLLNPMAATSLRVYDPKHKELVMTFLEKQNIFLTPKQRERFLKGGQGLAIGKKVGAAIRAHEIGHLETPRVTTLQRGQEVGRQVEKLPASIASGIVLASDPESKKARIAPIASGIAETVIVSPRLLREMLASRRGLKLLKELRYSKRTRRRAAKTLAYALGTYLVEAAPKIALSYAVPESIRRVKLRLKRRRQSMYEGSKST